MDTTTEDNRPGKSPPKPRRTRDVVYLGVAALVLVAAGSGLVAVVTHVPRPDNPFAALRHPDPAVADDGLSRIEGGWRAESAAMTLEVLPHTLHSGHREKLYDLLRRKTGQGFAAEDRNGWYRWLWTQPPPDADTLNRWRHEFYSANNGFPLGSLAGYFADSPTTLIRADEIRWGGVLRDGIPPVRVPVLLPASRVEFLDDDNVVYGVVIDGDARAYPRRILGHHEMVMDTVGGVQITGVYCTLCETMIAYHSRTADGRLHAFGTSGFLYRSNKLMYDADTLSLWSTVTGKPVVGKLAGTGVQLDLSPVVTTTWGEWKKAHPDSRVLSLLRLPNPLREGEVDYSEGAAYRDYYATDDRMFDTPHADARLKNKDEVFVPRLAGGHKPLALSTAFLRDHPVYLTTAGDTRLLVVTSPGGAHRAYAVGERTFANAVRDGTVTDTAGTVWAVGEDGLTAGGQPTLPRVPGHRAFWFGWHAAHPDTELVK